MKVQFNHPGGQKPFKLGNGYRQIGDKIIREWNNDNVHYRKFIQNYGYYVDDLKVSKLEQDTLYFWGEWEGNSFFKKFPEADFRILPNGLHQPFHSTSIRGSNDTDPYIFGDNFKYCICKQKGRLTTLELDDLIIFGTVLPTLEKFYIDTVFVIKDHNPSSNIQITKGAQYSQVYREETLEQLNHYLKPPTFTNNKKVYHSKTWWDDKNYFSFVPCKLDSNNIGFERLFIELNNEKFQLSKNPTGISFLERCTLSPQDLWKEIVRISLEQKFKLGIRFDEPRYNNILDNN